MTATLITITIVAIILYFAWRIGKRVAITKTTATEHLRYQKTRMIRNNHDTSIGNVSRETITRWRGMAARAYAAQASGEYPEPGDARAIRQLEIYGDYPERPLEEYPSRDDLHDRRL